MSRGKIGWIITGLIVMAFLFAIFYNWLPILKVSISNKYESLPPLEEFALLIGMASLGLTVVLTVFFSQLTNQKIVSVNQANDQLKITLGKIDSSTKELLDANRRIVSTFGDILDEYERILELIKNNNNSISANTTCTIHFMNPIMPFGYIHSYNKRFFRQKEDSEKERLRLSKRVENIEDSLQTLFKYTNTHILVNEDKELTEFIEKYFSVENSEEDRKQEYGLFDGEKERDIKSTNKRIKRFILDRHIELMNSARNIQKSTRKNETFSHRIKGEIDVNVFLAKYTNKKGETRHETFAVYFADKSGDSKPSSEGAKKREFAGFSTSNENMYMMMSKLFNSKLETND